MKKHITRRSFVSSLGFAGLAAIPHLPALASPGVLNGSILKCAPYLQAPDPESMTIRWITHTPSFGWVDYGMSADKLNNKAYSVDDGLTQANNTVHSIILKGLEPGTTYYYRAVSKNIDDFHPYKLKYGNSEASQVFSFTTPDQQKDEIRFLVFNDIHDRPESFPVLLKYQEESPKDFVFLNGDMFNWQVDEDQLINHLLKPLCDSFASNTPFIFSRGNHEARGKFARQIGDYFDGGEQKFYYGFQQGPLYAIVLDSGEDKEDSHPEYSGLVSFDAYRIKQKEWLEKEIKKKAFRNAKFKVVFSHIPLHYSGEKHGTMHCREQWGPLLNKAGIDVLISGHTHRHGIHPAVPGVHEYPIVIGGGKKDGSRTIMNVKVTQKKLNLRMIDDSGATVGSLDL